MKKKWKARFSNEEKCAKIFRIMRFTLFILLGSMMQLSASVHAQQSKVSIEMRGVSLEAVLWSLEKKSEMTFFYNQADVSRITQVDAVFKEATLSDILNELLKGTNLYYQVLDETIVIKQRMEQIQDSLQFVEIKGTVVDADGIALPGVTVLLKGTSAGTATGKNGQFSLPVPRQGDVVLRFTFIGMKPREIAFKGERNFRVTMEPDESKIEEVVITGYQNIKAKDMTGAFNKVKAEDLIITGVASIEQLLQGFVPGMVVTNPDGLVGTRARVRVRGTSTLLSNPEPVWVVDGIIQTDPVPFNTQDLGNMSGDNFDMIRNFIGNSIAWLNPNDIDNITVLKDAASTVLYGVKAANGVIVITTKQGKSDERGVSIGYSGGMNFSQKLTYKKMNLMNSKERIDVSREMYETRVLGNRPAAVVGYEYELNRYLNKEISYFEFNDAIKKMEAMNTDWMDILYRNPISHSHNINMSGGNGKVNYFTSFNYSRTYGIAKGNESESYGGNIRMGAKVNEKLNIDARLSGSVSTTSGFYTVDPYGYAIKTSRTISPYGEDGKLFYYPSGSYLFNVLNELAETGNSNTNRNLNSSVSLNYTLIPGLRYETAFGFTATNAVGESYASENSTYIANIRGYNFGAYAFGSDAYLRSELPHGGELNTTESHGTTVSWRNSLSFNTVFGEKHRFGMILGQELSSAMRKSLSTTVYGYFPDRGKGISLPSRIIKNTNNQDIANPIYNRLRNVIAESKANTISFYSSATYSFDERYVLSASIRTDASNRFGQDKRNRFLPVWSLGGRWNVHSEPWMRGQNVLSELNFRATYGWQGNVAEGFGPDLIAEIPTGSDVIHPVTKEYQLRIKTLPYADLRWEKTKSINLGIDLGVLQNRFTGTLEYYIKRTEDMIVYQELPIAYGTATMPVNGGKMTNQGVELSLNGTLIRSKDVTWSLGLNTAKNFNRIKSEITPNNTWQAAVSGNYHKEGYAVSSFWVFEFAGLDPNTGFPTFDLPTREENPRIVDDATEFMKYAGTLDPDFTGGLQTTFRYKTFSLSSNFNLNIGGKRFLNKLYQGNMSRSSLPAPENNLSKEYTNRWRKPGDHLITNIPAIPSPNAPQYTDPGSLNDGIYARVLYAYDMYDNSDARVVNASFLRCNVLSLSYSFTQRILDQLQIRNLSLSATISNPFKIVSKEFKGIDPEVATGSQPLTRNYSLNLNINF